jgi:signal transduction histidine kinase
VEIGSRSEPDGVMIYVKDYGYGIPKRQQGRIFEKFFRADNVVTKVTFGTGLGTYIMKSIMETHGGTIRFESEEDVGTTFYVTFPRAGAQKKRRRSRSTRRSGAHARA